MNWVSVALVVIIGLLTWRAYRSGIIREVVSLCSVILAIPIAGGLYPKMYPKFHPIVDNEALANLVCFLTIFFAVVIAGLVLGELLRNTVRMLNLGAVDQLAGAAFGFMKGVILCQVLLIVLVKFPEPDITAEIDESPVATGLLETAPLVLSILPERFDQAVDLFLTSSETIEDLAGR